MSYDKYKTFGTEKQSDFAKALADKLISQLQKGTSPWQRPEVVLQAPINALTGKPYRGGNALALMLQERKDPRWLTYNQAQTLGAQVRKGEKGTRLLSYIFEQEITLKDDNGNPLLDEKGKPQKTTQQLERPIVTSFVVFNAEQIDNLPPYKAPTIKQEDINKRAETILTNSGAIINHHNKDRAYYSPKQDSIYMPPIEAFRDKNKYYSTALHELGHWTGHSSRLNRDLTGSFGSPSYAKEELRAEITSLMLCQKMGIGHNFENHASYVGAWVRILQDDPNEILRASRDAEKISDYIMAFDRELVQDNRNNQPQEELKQEYFEAKTKGFTAGSTILEAAIKKAELIMNGQATIQSPLLAHADKYEVTTHLLAGASNEASFMTDIHTRSIINKVFEAGLDIIELDEEYNRTHKSIVDTYGDHFSRIIALEELIYQERNNEYEMTM